jgi:hypothetical protein
LLIRARISTLHGVVPRKTERRFSSDDEPASQRELR